MQLHFQVANNFFYRLFSLFSVSVSWNFNIIPIISQQNLYLPVSRSLSLFSDDLSIDEFEPENYCLVKEFALTKFAELIGWGCKVPQVVLSKLLSGTFNESPSSSSDGLGNYSLFSLYRNLLKPEFVVHSQCMQDVKAQDSKVVQRCGFIGAEILKFFSGEWFMRHISNSFNSIDHTYS